MTRSRRRASRSATPEPTYRPGRLAWATVESVILPVLIGLGVGVVVGALGAGGGILMFPVLVFLLGQDPQSAAASSAVIVGLSAAVSIIHHARRGRVAWADGLLFGGVSVFATVAGSRLSGLIPSGILLGLFAVLLAGIAIVMGRNARDERRREGIAHPVDVADPVVATAGAPVSRGADGGPAPGGTERRWLRLIITASLTGLVTGLFGVGGGFLVLPMLVLAMGLPIRRASGTSLLVMIIATSVSLLARLGTDATIDWPLTVLLAVSSMVGGALGGPLASHARPSTLTAVFAVLLGGVSVVTLVHIALH